ncbi:MAG: T9SS type A sorting domain-containing protein [Muribaculaceae bacterium]|nr:T9SS type A sorting domain-containing protein [Muribaculaceae bacterium]
MKITRLKMLILFCVIVVGSLMGNEITKTHNLPQNGDNFTKTRMSFVAPGDSGKNIVWDFSQAQVVDGNSKVFYSVIDDSLINTTEYGTRYDFRLRGDTLLWRGYENRSTFMRDSNAAIELIYPMRYGDNASKPYCFHGEYSRSMAVRINGSSSVFCDGEGVIYLPDGDTITGVIRVHRICNSTINMMRKEDDTTRVLNIADTTMRRIEERYTWYARGYRYPIVETIINTNFYRGKETGKQGATFICYPSEQTYKTNDKENQILRQQTKSNNALGTIQVSSKLKEDADGSNAPSIESPLANNDIVISYKDETLKITFSNQTVNAGGIDYVLCDVLGRVFASGNTNNPNLEINELPQGDYILSINNNGEQITRKIPLKH